MKRILALAAVAVLGMAGSAMADVKVVTSLVGGETTLNLGGVETSTNLQGLEVRTIGDHGELKYDISVLSASGDTNATELDAEVSYLYGEQIGGKVRSIYADVGGVSDTTTYAGLTGAYHFDTAKVYGDILSDVDNFGDNNLYKVGLATQFGEYKPFAELTHLDRKNAGEVNIAEIGVSYDLSDRTSLFGSYTHAEDKLAGDKLSTDAVKLGVGFRF